MNSEELKRKRLDLGLSQKALAKAVDKSRKTINQYENGANIPKDVQKLLNIYFDNVTKGNMRVVTDNEDRVEDIIAKKALKELEPLIQEKSDLILKAIANLHIELNAIKNEQAKAHEIIEVIEKRL